MSEPRLLSADELASWAAWLLRRNDGAHDAIMDHIAALGKALESARLDRDVAHATEMDERKASAGLVGEALRVAVAEDERMLRGVLDDEGMGGPDDAPSIALSRLAAKAQGYEAAILAWDDAARVSDAIARTTGPLSADERRHAMRPPSPGERLLQRYWEMYGKIEKERDAAAQRADAAEGLLDNADATATTAIWREEAAVADNAALLEALSEADHDDACHFLLMCAKRSGDTLGLPAPENTCDCFKAVEYRPHPGADLLAKHRAELDALNADNAAKDTAFATYVGMYGIQHGDVPGTETNCPEDNTCKCAHIQALNAAFGHGRPGTALLELANIIRQYQHRDEADVLATFKRLMEERSRIAHMVSEETHNALLEQHRKALVRARNEWLEMARVSLLERAAMMDAKGNDAASAWEDAAEWIAAMKGREQ